jgi:hypothetical protein
MVQKVRVPFLLLVLLLPPRAAGWGYDGHLCVNRVAAEKLPADVPLFLRSAVAELAYLGPEPDRWRDDSDAALKSSQEPDHYIDLERIAWLDPLPEGRYEFYQRLYEKRAQTKDHPDDYLPERVGLQPYAVMEILGRLKASFREYRQLRERHQTTDFVEHKIVFYAGWLGHYVGDGSQPLHTTIHYNGWVGANPKGYTTERGIHAEFETAYVSRNIAASDFANLVHAPEHIADPFARYIEYSKRSTNWTKRGAFVTPDRGRRSISQPKGSPQVARCSSISGIQPGWTAPNREGEPRWSRQSLR